MFFVLDVCSLVLSICSCVFLALVAVEDCSLAFADQNARSAVQRLGWRRVHKAAAAAVCG